MCGPSCTGSVTHVLTFSCKDSVARVLALGCRGSVTDLLTSSCRSSATQDNSTPYLAKGDVIGSGTAAMLARSDRLSG